MKLVQIVLLLVAVVLQSCGSSSSGNNDQGASFSLLGFGARVVDDDEDEEEECEPTIKDGVTGLIVPLNTLSENGVGATVRALVMNNMVGQAVRVERALVQYFIPNSGVQPPATTVAVPGIIGPAPGSSSSGGGDASSATAASTEEVETRADPEVDSSLPDSFDELCHIGRYEFQVLPPAVQEFINLNSASLPEPPFVLEATVELSGVTTAGDRLSTNQATLLIQITPGVTIDAGGSDEEESSTVVTEEDATSDEESLVEVTSE